MPRSIIPHGGNTFRLCFYFMPSHYLIYFLLTTERDFQILRNGPLRFDLILFWIQHDSIRSNPLDSDSTRSVHIQVAPKLLLRNGASIYSDPLRSASKPASTSNILLARPDFKTFRFTSRTDWLITVSPIFLRENRIVHTKEFYTLLSSLLESNAMHCEKRWKAVGTMFILTRAAHDEEAKMASVTLVCYAIQHVHERLSKIARMPPRIGHCNQLLHSSLSARVYVWVCLKISIRASRDEWT